jgi:hypothetical protein
MAMKMKDIRWHLSMVFTVYLLASVTSFAQVKLPTAMAKNHVGQKATVCGRVTHTSFASAMGGKPTYIDLTDGFIVVIWGSDRGHFNGKPEEMYRNKAVCVTGKILQYKTAQEIVVREPKMIEVGR